MKHLSVNAPNLITVARILAVPFTVWLMVTEQYFLAFLLFLAAGVSDAIDGFIAKRYGLVTLLGAYLDPIADKLLLVSIYITLGVQQLVPALLVILIVSRDVLIVGAIMLSWFLDKPVKLQPLLVSKANTAAQIALACAVMAALALDQPLGWLAGWGAAVVGVLTVWSGMAYVRDWLRHMANGNG